MHETLPAFDGGYVLMGVKTPCLALFTQMRWSTSTVAFETLRRMTALQLCVWQAPPLHDIDEPADLVHLPAACYGAQFLKSSRVPARFSSPSPVCP